MYDCTSLCKRDGDHREGSDEDVLFYPQSTWVFPSVTSDKSCPRQNNLGSVALSPQLLSSPCVSGPEINRYTLPAFIDSVNPERDDSLQCKGDLYVRVVFLTMNAPCHVTGL